MALRRGEISVLLMRFHLDLDGYYKNAQAAFLVFGG